MSNQNKMYINARGGGIGRPSVPLGARATLGVKVRSAGQHFARPETRIAKGNRAEAGPRNFSERKISVAKSRFEPYNVKYARVVELVDTRALGARAIAA